MIIRLLKGRINYVRSQQPDRVYVVLSCEDDLSQNHSKHLQAAELTAAGVPLEEDTLFDYLILVDGGTTLTHITPFGCATRLIPTLQQAMHATAILLHDTLSESAV